MGTESMILEEQAPKAVMAGSNLPGQIQDAKPAGHPTAPLDTAANLSPATFSIFFYLARAWRGESSIGRRPNDGQLAGVCLDQRVQFGCPSESIYW